jgi:hypothetical protein
MREGWFRAQSQILCAKNTGRIGSMHATLGEHERRMTKYEYAMIDEILILTLRYATRAGTAPR